MSAFHMQFLICDSVICSWATKAGQNFAANHAAASIDFAAVHIWTDNWSVSAPSQQYIVI